MPITREEAFVIYNNLPRELQLIIYEKLQH